jgi:hypothetical protein
MDRHVDVGAARQNSCRPPTRLLAVACLCFASTSFAANQSTEPVTVLSTTPLPEITGGDFDHFAQLP